MRFHVRKAISLLLAVALTLGLIVAAPSASADEGDLWYTFLDELALPNGQVTMEELNQIRDKYNRLRRNTPALILLIGPAVITQEGPYMRLFDPKREIFITRTDGGFPYYLVAGDVPATVPDPSEESANQWVAFKSYPIKRADGTLVPEVIITEDAMGDCVKQLNEAGASCTMASVGDKWIIAKTVNYTSYAYCNSKGQPYAAPKEGSAAITQNRVTNIVNKVDNSTENNYEVNVKDNVVDLKNQLLTVIGVSGDTTNYNIESLTFDSSDHSYTANTYQYDVTNNTYNYYTWNIKYEISNTYVTYIGSNDAYQQEEYKYYYELPDGRSSADLTADEIAGMSFQFSDVVNYARSATDTSLRALYHFDGNTDDSGYFSTQTTFTWKSGASITYMDSSAFNGALYLDETAHSFDITLPSNIGSGDFSLQFRYYQASQADTKDNKENTLSIGGAALLKWDERSFYWNGSSTACAQVPIGSWSEIALVRHNGTLYFYLNGLKIASSGVTTPYLGTLSFSLGSTSRAYSMLDELRFVNFAIAADGTSYACTAVPYDTNLVLVLPDSAFPIADEYWNFHNEAALVSNDFTQSVVPDDSFVGSEMTCLCYPGYTSIKSSLGSSWTGGNFGNYQTTHGFGVFWKNAFAFASTQWATYYFSVVDAQGNIYTLPFEMRKYSSYWQIREPGTSGTGTLYSSSYSFGYLHVRGEGNSSVGAWIMPRNGVTFEFIYGEISTEPLTAEDFEKVSCIYSSEEVKPNTAAVQSDIPVKGYTVGGVRPTFPQRGDVWFPVEGSRISGVQIYNGQAWESTNARYYTGTRWIPIYAFNIYTLEDCWDISDKEDVSPPISTETGFWNWWKSAWKEYEKHQNEGLDKILEAIAGISGGGSGSGGGGSGGDVIGDDQIIEPVEDDDGETWGLWELVKALTKGVWNLVTGVVSLVFGGLKGVMDMVGSIGGFFSSYDGFFDSATPWQ